MKTSKIYVVSYSYSRKLSFTAVKPIINSIQLCIFISAVVLKFSTSKLIYIKVG